MTVSREKMIKAAAKALGRHRMASPHEIELIIDAAMKAGMADAIERQRPWPPTPEEASDAVRSFGLNSDDDLKAAMVIAVEAIRMYGAQVGDEFKRATENPWSDLAEVQAALAAIRLVREFFSPHYAKRPAAFRVQRHPGVADVFEYYANEDQARVAAEAVGADYEGLYTRRAETP